jgi:hypothetical protein
MRILILALAASSLALSGCGKKEATGNTTALDQAASAQDFTTNDVTAIDAATGADANMAADVDINFVGDDGGAGSGNAAAPSRARPRSATNTSDSAEPAEQQPATRPATGPVPPTEPAPSNSTSL